MFWCYLVECVLNWYSRVYSWYVHCQVARSFLHYLVAEFRTGCSVLVVISFEFRRVNFLYQLSVDLSHYLLAMQLIVPGYIYLFSVLQGR